MKKLRNRFCMVSAAALLAVGMGIVGCGNSGGGGTTTTTTTSSLTEGYELPSEISAVPTDNTDTSARLRQLRGMSSHLRALARAVGDLPADSDYAQAVGSTYVEEPALEQFDIIEQILNAISQTNYAATENINQGPYTAMVAWMDENNGMEVKQLEPWVVQSDMIVENGQDVNRLRAWIEEPDEMVPGQTRTIKCEMKIFQAATTDTDGSILDYGKWTMNVKFDDTGTSFFVAEADIENGMSVIKINEYEDFGGGETHLLKGFLYRTGTQGYGKMQFTDWDTCTSWPCTPSLSEAVYAYNADYLGVQKNSDPTIYKDRDPVTHTKMTHRYGLFFSDSNSVLPTGITAGDNLMKAKQFGFPVIYTDSSGLPNHYYYGAWQGRHQLWGGDGSGLTVGDSVIKEDWRNNTQENYTVGAVFNGSFTKRTLVEAALSDIENIPVETWVDKHFELIYFDYDADTQDEWAYCKGWVEWDWMTSPPTPTCKKPDGSAGTFVEYTNYSELVVNGPEDRKWVNANGCDMSGCTEYIYLATDPGTVTWGGAGFYEATWGSMGMLEPVAGASLYTPTTGDTMWISVGGSIYIAYTGTGTTGWVQKALLQFDSQNWQPVFDDTGDTDFSPEIGREYYMNANGVNYVVRRIAETGTIANDYEAKLEVQKTANPSNCNATDCSIIVPAGTSYLAMPWDPGVRFTLVTDPTDSNYLHIVYITDDPNTQGVDESAVTTILNNGWGLQAFNNSGAPLKSDGSTVAVDEWGFPTDPNVRPVEFNWEYCDPTSGNDWCWGTQTYLKDASGDFVVLSDPVSISIDSSVALNDYKGDPIINKALLLQYDGWMGGLPDLYHELANNDFVMTTDIRNKIINLPEGLEVSDGDGYAYYVKPLETSIFLSEVSNTTPGIPDISQGAALDLSALPTFTDHGMGATPTGTEVKYIEGIPVSELN